MSETNLIYDINGNLIGRFKLGVAWKKPERIRLGEYDDEFVYDNNSSVLAKVNDGHVLNIIGDEIGYIKEKEIYVSDEKVGSFLGCSSAGAASVALIFNKGTTNDS